MPRRRKHHRLVRYRAAMFLGPGPASKYLNRYVMGTSSFDAAQRISYHHLGGATVFPGRHEGSHDGYPMYSYAVEGFGQRLWIRRGG